MGILALMGSGELTATMVEVHKLLLSAYRPEPQAMFLDTPAGFQLNADQIGETAAAYFRKRVECPLQVVSFKSAETIAEIDAARAYQQLRRADYILMGPGSPTYTVKQLKASPIPEILLDHIDRGGCLVAASAAALTAGRFTLPVYEIYKVGMEPHWVEGLDLLGAFDLSLVVIPHWNNAEGGSHDTSRCFMGKSRFAGLVDLLDEPLPILGLDEHTACIIDFSAATFTVHGIGTAVLQDGSKTHHFSPGTRYPLHLLQDARSSAAEPVEAAAEPVTVAPPADDGEDFWPRLHELTAEFHYGIDHDDLRRSAHALLEMDRILWQAQGDLENLEAITQARDLFREKLAEIGTREMLSPAARRRVMAPLVDSLLAARQQCRTERQFAAADLIRDALTRAGIAVEDTTDGYRWRNEAGTEDSHDRSS